MTIEAVDTATGEIVADLTATEAEECLRHIVAAEQNKTEWAGRLYHGRGWRALGYASWEELCQFRLGGARIALPRDERPAAVQQLRDQGLSTRAIGSVLGVHHDTVADDIKKSGVGNPTPDGVMPKPVTGRDGKTYSPRPKPPAVEPKLSAAEPKSVDKSTAAVLARRERIRELADSGMTSGQIADELGVSEANVRRLARDMNVVITADEALRKRPRTRIDPNNVVEQTVRAAEPSSVLALVDFTELDPALLEEWISSLSESLKALRSLKSALEKELNRVRV